MNLNIDMKDIGQISIGSFAFAVPISFSEEAWRISESLPFTNLTLVFLLSVSFLALFAYESVFQGQVVHRIFVFIIRIIIAYIISAFVVALVLISIDKLPLLTEPIIAIKRLIVITMPASMGAIIVDSFDKE
ncbi:DUF2391 family protein [Arcobacter roscoffensis]|uniref:DUF2391 family protein n=1 Tax=Arcobacter roscoffensis TaxID=2961520 RepID=A0ABY5EA88_9BACT|nr:DUF2391 family protein [Arcobacter roscoffensis]UTJ07706.1 DUF2391 family protein [Arcobacter roscoffensis]